MNARLTPNSEQHDQITESNDEMSEKEYIATLAVDSNTLTEFVILEPLIQLDGILETPMLLITEEMESQCVKTQIVINGNDEVFEVHTNHAIHCEDKKDLYEQNVTMNGETSRTQRQSGKSLATSERKNNLYCQHKQKCLKCDVEGCCRTFMWPAHLKYHSLTHTGTRQFKCPHKDCDKCFYTQQRLDVHLRTHTGERPFMCDVSGCDKGFTTAGNLKNHMRVHTGEKPFACEIEECGKRFAELSSLKKHCLVHTGDRPFACDYCGKTFSQLGSRNVHLRRHHSKNGSTPELCPSVSNRLHLQNNSISEILQNCEQTTITLTQGVQVVEFSKDEVNFDVAEAIVIPATISTSSINTDTQKATHWVKTSKEATNKMIQETKFLPPDGNLAYSVVLPHSNANVLVLAQPQSVPELGYHLPPRENLHIEFES